MKSKALFLVCLLIPLTSQAEWILQNSGFNGKINDIHFINYNLGYCACDGGRLLKTVNGGANWFNSPGPFTSSLTKVIFFDHLTGLVFGSYGIFKTTDGGINWNNVNNGLRTILDCSVANENTLYLSFMNETYSGIMRSEDRGQGWSSVYYILHFAPKLHFLNKWTGFGAGYYYAGNQTLHRLYKTTDGASQWNVIFNFESTNGNGDVGDIYFSGNDTGYYSVRNQSGSYIFRFIASTGWSQYNTEYFQRALFFINGTSGWAAGEAGKIFKTTNSGLNWLNSPTPVTTSLLDIEFVNDLTGWAAGENGVIIKTTNGGAIGIKPISSEVPEKFVLYQNYPNPFNPTTKIRFALPSVGQRHAFDLQLVVYDVLGRQIETIVNEELRPGTYEVEWIADNYPSGVYYYKLVSNNYIESKKMILIK